MPFNDYFRIIFVTNPNLRIDYKELKKTSVQEWLSNNSKKKLPTGQLLKRIIYLFALTTKFVPKPDSKIIVFGGRI